MDQNLTGRSKFLRILLAVLLVFNILVAGIIIYSGSALFTNSHGVGNLVKVISLVREQYLTPVSTDQLVDGAIKGMVSSLNDPYSVYMEPSTFSSLQEQIRGSFGGLGILVGLKNQALTVVRTYPGTPAAKAGLKAGDVISRIGDKDTKGIDLETAVNIMRGAIGSKVTIGLERQGLTKEYTLTREEIAVPTVEGKLLPNSKTGYIIISQFSENTGNEFVSTLNQLRQEGMDALILDLRDNPGGELTAAVKVADQLLGKGPVVYIQYRSGATDTYESDAKALNLPLVVLVNKGSASAAEILAGAVKDTQVGTLVGTRTFGKGIVQTVFPLANGAGLKLTTARYLTPAKHDINKKGIEPDVVVNQPENATKDLQMEKALELIKEKLAK